MMFLSYLNSSVYEADSVGISLLGSYAAAFQIYGGTAFFGGRKYDTYPAAYDEDGTVYVPYAALKAAFSLAAEPSGGVVATDGGEIAVAYRNGTAYISFSAVCGALGYGFFYDGQSFAFAKKNMAAIDKDRQTYIEAYNYLLYERPLPSAIYEKYVSEGVSGSHPRLIADTRDFADIKKRAVSDPVMRGWVNKLIVYADSLVAGGLPDYSTYDGKRIGCANRDTNKLMYILAAYRLTGDSRYSDKAYLYLSAFGSFPSWNPSHFLDVGNICASFGVAYDWCYDAFTKEQRADICKWVKEKGLEVALEKIRGRGSWTKLFSNWNFVCNGGVATAALSFMDEYPELCAALLALNLRGLESALNAFAPKGGWEEGSGYWEYANQYLSYMMLSMKTALGTEYGYYYNTPGLENTGYYALALDGPQGSFNYHDTPAKALFNAYQLSFHAYMTGDGAFAYARVFDIETYNFTPNLIDIVCCDTAADQKSLPLDIYIAGEETGALRSGWDGGDTYLDYHCGQNTANHFNYDAGNFIFDSMGVRWAVDNGYPNFADYDASGWGTREENRFYVKRTEGQNCYVINPSYATGQNTNTLSSVVMSGSSTDSAFAVMDITSAYSGVISALRGVMLTDGRTSAVIRDEIKFTSSADFCWFMQTTAEVTVNGNTAILAKDGKTLTLEFVSNQSLSLSVGAAEPLSTSNQLAGTLPADTRRIMISGTVSGEFTLTAKLTPSDGKTHGAIPDIPLELWRSE